MTTAWDWHWYFERWSVFLTIDLCDFMIGIAWGEIDIVIKPVPFVVISIERFRMEGAA